MTAVTDRDAIDLEHERLLAEQNGRSIEDMTNDDPEPDEQLQLLDFGDTLNLAVKGTKPTDSEIKIASISRPIKGQIGDAGDDEIVTVLVTCRQGPISFIPKHDGDGRVVAKTRRHSLTPISVYPLTQEQANLVLGVAEE